MREALARCSGTLSSTSPFEERFVIKNRFGPERIVRLANVSAIQIATKSILSILIVLVSAPTGTIGIVHTDVLTSQIYQSMSAFMVILVMVFILRARFVTLRIHRKHCG